MSKSRSVAQSKAIADIVAAVRQGRNRRAGRLLDQFVLEADLPALLALRDALADDLSGPPLG